MTLRDCQQTEAVPVYMLVVVVDNVDDGVEWESKKRQRRQRRRVKKSMCMHNLKSDVSRHLVSEYVADFELKVALCYFQTFQPGHNSYDNLLNFVLKSIIIATTRRNCYCSGRFCCQCFCCCCSCCRLLLLLTLLPSQRTRTWTWTRAHTQNRVHKMLFAAPAASFVAVAVNVPAKRQPASGI